MIFFIAEMSANHNQHKDIIGYNKAAKTIGNDVIKIWINMSETMTLECNKPDFICKRPKVERK